MEIWAPSTIGRIALPRNAVHTHRDMISALDLDEGALAERLTSLGEPAYRARQIRTHLLRRGVLAR